ncbi:multisubunit sodium/proton antiporter MrpE subunit [Prauserella shujinwangii]|uniref:Multisubunit sodium/proton antiporter MrpE subunit n=1 Tax=Prauserella shujinwangii TaxID=1453103 RepID=A0A2T0LRS7_9PSEU|nr:Na+/H+ antiporter subunit E [Prauserella shujinwangii]PRX46197.1 multisubunit sodium/proton antiporter MrpE subunit [Prauserella shujinwangii]
MTGSTGSTGTGGGRFSLTLFCWLVIVWLLLWGGLRPVVLLSAPLVALGVLLLFPMPTRRVPVLRPLRLLRLAGFVLLDLVVSAVRNSREVVQYGRDVRAAVVAVPVLSDVDHVVATAANLVSLTPDKFVLHIDRRGGVYYVYCLGVRSDEQVARAHDQVIDLQVRAVRALAPSAEARDAGRRADRCHRRGPVSPEKSPEEEP